MKKQEFDKKIIIYLISLLSYILLLAYSLKNGSSWIIDNSIAIIALLILFLVDRKIDFKKSHLILFNMILLLHNLGSIGFYSFSWKFFAYDNLVHFISSLIAAFILYDLIYDRMNRMKSFFRVHKRTISFLVFGFVIMLGVMIELVEFTGQNLFGSGEGLFLAGVGDGFEEGSNSQYDDTMTDFVSNLLGTISGTFYFFRKNRMS